MCQWQARKGKGQECTCCLSCLQVGHLDLCQQLLMVGMHGPINQLSALERYSGSPCCIEFQYHLASGFTCWLSIWAVIISSFYWLMIISSCSGWWCSKSSNTLSHGLGKLCITLGYSRCLSLLNKVATATSSQTT